MEFISEAPKLLVMKISAREKSTRRLSPSVSVALSRIPSNRFHSASLAFFYLVEEYEAQLPAAPGCGIDPNTSPPAQQRMGLAMAQITRRRADEPGVGNLMTVLKLGAVNLDDRAPISQQALRCSFPPAGSYRNQFRSKEQQVTDRTARDCSCRRDESDRCV